MVQYIHAHVVVVIIIIFITTTTTTIIIITRVSCNAVLLRTAQHTKISNIRKCINIAIQGLSPLQPFTLKFHFSSLPISFCLISSPYQTCWDVTQCLSTGEVTDVSKGRSAFIFGAKQS
jgi:hypothetical protein